MNAVGPDSTSIPDPFEVKSELGSSEEGYVADMSQAMWNYRNRGTFDGLPVAP